MDTPNDSLVKRLLECLTDLERKQFLSYLRSDWNLLPKYQWMETHLATYTKPGSKKAQADGAGKGKQSPPTKSKEADGKLAVKLREFLALKRLQDEKPLLDYLFLLALQDKAIGSKKINPELAGKIAESFGKLAIDRLADPKLALNKYQLGILIAKIKNDGNHSGVGSLPAFQDATEALDVFYLRERLSVECAKISNAEITDARGEVENITDDLDVKLDQERVESGTSVDLQERLALVQWAEMCKPPKNLTIDSLLTILKDYCSEKVALEGKESMVNDLSVSDIDKEDLTLITGLLHNIVIAQLKKGRSEFSNVLWLLLKLSMEKSLILAEDGSIPLAVSRNLLMQATRTQNGEKALMMLSARKKQLGMSDAAWQDFYRYAKALVDYSSIWKSRNIPWTDVYGSLNAISFKDEFLKFLLVELRFRLEYHLKRFETPIPKILDEMKQVVRSSNFWSKANLQLLEAKIEFYERLWAGEGIAHPRKFATLVQESIIDASDKEWLVEMAKRKL